MGQSAELTRRGRLHCHCSMEGAPSHLRSVIAQGINQGRAIVYVCAVREKEVVAQAGAVSQQPAVVRALASLDRAAADEHGVVSKTIDRIGRRASLGMTYGELQVMHVLVIPGVWLVCVTQSSFPARLAPRFLHEMAQVWEGHGGIPLENPALAGAEGSPSDGANSSTACGGGGGAVSTERASKRASTGGRKRRSYVARLLGRGTALAPAEDAAEEEPTIPSGEAAALERRHDLEARFARLMDRHSNPERIRQIEKVANVAEVVEETTSIMQAQ